MYFRQLVSKLENPVIQVETSEEKGWRSAYDGELFNLPLSLFRKWHDCKVLEIIPKYNQDEKKPVLRIVVEYEEEEYEEQNE